MPTSIDHLETVKAQDLVPILGRFFGFSEVTKYRQELNELCSRHADIIEKESKDLEREYGIENAEKLQKAIEEIEDKDKVLQIGIVGRVKAGKSSLLNALVFNGQSILPKAATPMTASLVVISYGEKLLAEVDFFSKEDISDIKENSEKYDKKLNSLILGKEKELKDKKKTIEELKGKATRQALRAMKEDAFLTSAHEQYAQIKASGVTLDDLNSTIEASNIDELKSKLADYVGADGKYMPFTKSVNIQLPQENLKNVQIVDTPGVNDPVQSREERTRELLKFCDVIFIVSPSGQFMSKEDTDLMDRITSKEGVREIFVVASQVDNQLFGSEKQNANGVLVNVLDGITKRLGNHMSVTLKQLKEQSPEVGNVFDKLIEDGNEKVLHSSGICEVIKRNFDDKESWDDGTKKVWENLTREYPDYFSDNKELSVANLDLLSNMTLLHEHIETVKNKKDEILAKRREEFTQTKLSNLNAYKSKLGVYATEQLEQLKSTDIEELKTEKIKIANIQSAASSNLNETYLDLVEELEQGLGSQLKEKLRSYFRDAKGEMNDAEGSRSESYEHEKSGAGNWFARKLWGGGSETRTRTYTTARAGAIRSSIETLTSEIEYAISMESKHFIGTWRKNIYAKLVSSLRGSVGDNEIDVSKIKSLLRKVVNSVNLPDIEYSSSLPESLRKNGTLEGSTAERFLADAQDYVSDFRSTVNSDLKEYQSNLIGKLNGLNLSDELFSSYTADIEKVEEEMKHKEMTIEKYESFISTIKGMACK